MKKLLLSLLAAVTCLFASCATDTSTWTEVSNPLNVPGESMYSNPYSEINVEERFQAKAWDAALQKAYVKYPGFDFERGVWKDGSSLREGMKKWRAENQ